MIRFISISIVKLDAYVYFFYSLIRPLVDYGCVLVLSGLVCNKEVHSNRN